MITRYIVAACAFGCLALTTPAVASNPDGSALKAVSNILFGTSESEARLHVADDATFGDQRPGSLVAGLEDRSWSEPIASQIEHVTFFDADELATLAKAFPNPMWDNVDKHLGSRRGVLVRFLTADSSSVGARSAGASASLVFVIGGEGKIVHMSTDDEQ